MKTVDARGLFCPEPVVMTQKAVASGESEYEILVDNKTCVENVSRFASSKGFQVETVEKNGEYAIMLRK